MLTEHADWFLTSNKTSEGIANSVEGRSTALANQHQGRFAEAEDLYRAVLQEQPNHIDALHLLGVVRMERGQFAEAVDSISRAIAVDAAVMDFHFNLGCALQKLGRLAEAQSALRQAVALRPDSAAAHNALGNLHLSGWRDRP